MFETVRKQLEANGFCVHCFGTAQQAAQWLNAEIDGTSVGFGGSMTLEEMGLYDLLKTHNTVHWHHRIPAGETGDAVRAAANAAEVYVSSVNGLAETGEIVNIDNNCNRVAAIYYGHKTVYLVIGKNKLAADFESALHRARNIAAPLNAQRLNRKTPCAVNADRCYDCKSPERICRGLSVLWQRPASGHFEILLIDEVLGY